MKNILLTLFGIALGVSVQAQLVNNGGTIIVESGAVLFVESDIENNSSGTITNSGIIEVQGDLNNALGTLTSGAGSTIEFSGTAAANFTPGTHTVSNVVMSKSSADVTLLGDLQVDEDLSFQAASKLNTSSHTLTLDENATITTPAMDRYVIADAGVGGSVVKMKNNTDDVTFPIGDATSYTPVDVTGIAGTTGVASTISASTEGIKAPNAPIEATDFINRYWDVEATGITDFEATLVGTYNDADVDGAATEASISGAGYDGMAWAYVGSLGDAAANQVTVDVDYDAVEFTGTNKFGRVDLTAYLEAAFASGTMTTDLRDLDLIPLTSPYAEDPVVATSIPTDVVDWVLIEVRDVSDPSVVSSFHSAFLMDDGSVAGLDGSSLPLLRGASGQQIVALRHRNHLPVRTNVALDLDNPTAFDFSSSSDVYADPAISTPNMKSVGGTNVLWGGNANSDDDLQYNGGGLNDRIAMLLEVGFSTTSIPTDPGYYNEDVNMDGVVQYNGGGLNDRILLLLNVGFSTTSIPLLGHL